MWEISKQFDFCYGHRVWTQELKEEFSLDTSCACRHLHGHQGSIIVYLQATNLQNGMVTDFKHLNWFKRWLDETLDHKMILDIDDPLIPYEIPYELQFVWMREDYAILEGYEKMPKPLQEKYQGIVLVRFTPTSENLSKWIHEIIQTKMKKIDVYVSRVQFFETPKSQSNYIP